MVNKVDARVIVIGAGPAGSWLAYKLAKNNIDVLILEKESWPRYKPCGGALSNKTVKLLKDNNIVLPDNIIENVVNNFNFRFYFQKSINYNYKGQGIKLVDRNKFDDYLLKLAKEAGAEFKSEEKVINVDIYKNEVLVVTERNRYKCEIIAGADGANSKTSYLLDLLPDKISANKGMAVEMEIDDTEDIYIDRLNREELLIDFGFIPAGYAWVFPKKNHLSIGLWTQPGEKVDFKDELKKYLSRLNIPYREDFGNFFYRGHPIPFNGKAARNIKVGGKRFLLVGDAAYFADPFVGEGIYYACLSAELAAETIIECYTNNTLDLSSYRERVKQELYLRFEVIEKLANIFNNELNYFKKILSIKPSLIGIFLDVIQGKYSYHKLSGSLFDLNNYFCHFLN